MRMKECKDKDTREQGSEDDRNHLIRMLTTHCEAKHRDKGIREYEEPRIRWKH